MLVIERLRIRQTSAAPAPNAMDTVTFNLQLSEAQQQARASVPLPYTNDAFGTGQGWSVVMRRVKIANEAIWQGPALVRSYTSQTRQTTLTMMTRTMTCIYELNQLNYAAAWLHIILK